MCYSCPALGGPHLLTAGLSWKVDCQMRLSLPIPKRDPGTTELPRQPVFCHFCRVGLFVEAG